MDGLRLTATISPITFTGHESHTNPSKIRPLGFNFSLKHPLASSIVTKCNISDVVAVEDTTLVHKTEESENEGQNGNWVLRVLQVRSLWKTQDDDDHMNQDSNEQVDKNDDHDQISIDEACDTCSVDDDDGGVEFDKNSFSKLLRTVSLSEARLYAKMAYLGSLSYTIPKIKFGNLLKRHKLHFITSSLEKKAKKERTSEMTQQDPKNVDVSHDLNSLYSSPCEWYICDDDESNTRYFVIQGSESIASWQANLLFEPMQFEAMDAIVHRGIYEAAKVVYEEMLPYVHDHLERHGNGATIRLTGHSLGGSLSLLVNLMLLIRGQVHVSSLLPVITFGAPWVMCGGDRLLQSLGLPRNHLQGMTMHRDIVPRAFSCNYPTRVAHLLKVVNGNFRNHPCLNNQNLLYAPMGEFLILQPDAKLSPNHDLLPSGSGLYVLRSQASDPNLATKQTRAAQSVFLNTPHPLEILTDRCAYGSEGAILRDHDVDTYLISIRKVISQELNRARKMRRQQQRQFWWHMVMLNGTNVKLLLDSGREWCRMVVATHNMHLLVVVLVPFARLWVTKACNWIRFRLCM
ncbi:putative fungal lipase-like domain, alpha/Beta hydrolase, phospholipase A1 PLIP1/2/3 [Helianthus annuus]|nr:putative fungal lipase-like domain, alpha/Beta hydrolase, phospholipase A1 PLIP1/2/3 [Helianthus annuus]KAJ0882660.1 putative fungal lipase-like domain, alpha/Beta hydrolase [Helianthus annuus]